MSRIYNYSLEVEDIQHVALPEGAQILHIGEHHGSYQLWALVDPHHQDEERTIHIAGTGNIMPPPGYVRHINTFTTEDHFVLHAFEVVV